MMKRSSSLASRAVLSVVASTSFFSGPGYFLAPCSLRKDPVSFSSE